MSVAAVPHERNGAKCPVCGRAVYFTGNGWKDAKGNGSHREPQPRGGGR